MLSRTISLDGRGVTVERALSEVDSRYTLTDQPSTINSNVISIVGLALFCDYLLLTLCVPILPALFGDSYSALAIGLVFASKPFFQFLANPYAGHIVGKYGPYRPLLIGVIILSISTLLFAFGVSSSVPLSSAYGIVLVARSVQGLASASTMSAGMTLCAVTHNEDIRGTALGMAMLGVALGTLMGPPLGGVLGYFVSYWFPFVLVAGMLLLDGVAQTVVLAKLNTGDSAGLADQEENAAKEKNDDNNKGAF